MRGRRGRRTRAAAAVALAAAAALVALAAAPLAGSAQGRPPAALPAARTQAQAPTAPPPPRAQPPAAPPPPRAQPPAAPPPPQAQPPAAAGPDELLPDLVSLAPGPLGLERRGRRTRLLLGNRVLNLGPGPLDLRPQRGDCDGDGDAANDHRAYQRVHLDADGDGRFSRRGDRRVRRYRASCTRFHPRHHHWHYDDFARYDLRRPSDGALLRTSRKVSFCLMDLFEDPSTPGRARAPRFVGCERDVPQGISVGWGDDYGPDLPGQHVDVTRLRFGAYCLVTTADPANTIREADDGNNAAAAAIVIGPRGVREARAVSCPALGPA